MEKYDLYPRRTLTQEWDWKGLCPFCRGNEATMILICLCHFSQLYKRFEAYVHVYLYSLSAFWLCMLHVVGKLICLLIFVILRVKNDASIQATIKCIKI